MPNHTCLFQQFQRLAVYSVKSCCAACKKKGGIIHPLKRSWKRDSGPREKSVWLINVHGCSCGYTAVVIVCHVAEAAISCGRVPGTTSAACTTTVNASIRQTSAKPNSRSLKNTDIDMSPVRFCVLPCLDLIEGKNNAMMGKRRVITFLINMIRKIFAIRAYLDLCQ